MLFQTITKNWQDEDRPLQFEDSTMRPDDMYRKRHLRQLVEQATAQLPEHHREVFVLRELEGKSSEEIAEITSCNLGDHRPLAGVAGARRGSREPNDLRAGGNRKYRQRGSRRVALPRCRSCWLLEAPLASRPRERRY